MAGRNIQTSIFTNFSSGLQAVKMKHFVCLCTLFLFISCDGIQESKKIDKDRITEEVKDMLFDYHKAIAKDGLTAEFDYLDQSSDFFWVPPGYRTTLNYDSVQNILQQNAKIFRSIEFQWNVPQVYPLSNEIASYSGLVVGHMIDTLGIETKVSLIESGTLIKRQSGWKLLNDQSAILDVE
ncbi:MAG: hypothetical protein COC08_00580 [Maribacter sp.]|nr:MAG: hypothetical protein COC08_00580 [Maribacter sp.]